MIVRTMDRNEGDATLVNHVFSISIIYGLLKIAENINFLASVRLLLPKIENETCNCSIRWSRFPLSLFKLVRTLKILRIFIGET